jgi:hypothetical protein
VINDVKLKIFIFTPPTTSNPEMLSHFMAQKSYLICIQINHVLNKNIYTTSLHNKQQQIFSLDQNL